IMVAWAERNVKIPWLKRAVTRYWPAGAFSLSLLFALLGQTLTSGREYPLSGALAFALATLLFLSPLWRSRAQTASEVIAAVEPAAPAIPLFQPALLRVLSAALALLFSVLTYVGFSGNQLDRGLLPWLVVLVFFLLAFADRSAGRR